MIRGNKKYKLVLIWAVFIVILVLTGVLIRNRLTDISLDYMGEHLSIQTEYMAKSVSDELLRETDKLGYIAKVIEKDGNPNTHVLHSMDSSSTHIHIGLMNPYGKIVAGDPVQTWNYPGIMNSFRGTKDIIYTNDCLVFTSPVFNDRNVQYVLYEIYDRFAMEERFSFYSHLDRKVSLCTRDGDIIMLFDDVSRNEKEFFMSDEYYSSFADLYREMKLDNRYAKYYSTDKGDYFCFTADVPYTEFRINGYMSSSVMERGLSDAVTLIIYVFGFLTILFAIATFYLMMTSEKLWESDELRAAKQAAEDANKAKSDFLASMSHEIRTPINAILGMDEMIIRESDNEQIMEYAGNINNAGKSLLSLINDILDFSKIEAGKMEILPDEYRTSFFISDLASMIAVRAHSKDLDFIVNADPTLPSVLFGDVDRVKQCALNILTNAVKYTEKGSVTFNVSYEKLSDTEIFLNIAVTDTGIGIREEDIEKLFTPFERVDEMRNRSIEGTGLGLSIVKKLLFIMGSALKVESEYGNGSTFSFKLKQGVRDWRNMGNFAESYRRSVLSRNKYTESFRAPDARVLVVDDTEMNLTVFEGLLKKTEIRIDTVLSGQEALELAKRNKYDIMFIDHRMPVMDGVDTLNALNEMQDNLNKGVPCIAFTANAGTGSREKYRSYGFDDYISKPVSPSDLEKIIIRYIPPEKVDIVEADDADKSNGAVVTEADEAFTKAYEDAEGLSYNVALANCGSVDVLKDTAITFFKTIDDRLERIRTAYNARDLDNYTIQVHSLKSSARIIGAVALSVKAEYLEKCGKEANYDEIKDKTDDLLQDYTELKETMGKVIYSFAEITSENEDQENESYKESVRQEVLISFVQNSKEAVEDFDFDAIMDNISLLREYKLTDELKEKINRLSGAAENLEEEDVKEILDDISSNIL